MENFFIQMEVFMKVNGKMTLKMALDHIIMQAVAYMKENGKII